MIEVLKKYIGQGVENYKASLLDRSNEERYRRLLNHQVDRRAILKAGLALGASSMIPEGFDLETERKFYQGCEVFMYHDIDPVQFEADIRELQEKGYQPISHEMYVQAMKGEIQIPDQLKTFMITIDDGRKSQFKTLNVIDKIREETGIFIPLNFFVPMYFSEPKAPLESIDGNTPCFEDGGAHEFMSRDQIIEIIRRGHHVFNHTERHGDLLTLNQAEKNGQIDTAELRIGTLYDLAGQPRRKYNMFSYPLGDYQGVQNYIKDKGFDVAFITPPWFADDPQNLRHNVDYTVKSEYEIVRRRKN